MKYIPKEIQENVNISKVSPIKELVILLGSILGIVLFIYISLGFAIDIVAQKMPPNMEKQLGKIYVRNFGLKETRTPEEANLQELLDRLKARLPGEEKEFQIHLMKVKEANALALPGGHVIVTEGLIKKVDSENELAMILAHELGHFANRDHLKGIGRGLVLTVFSIAVLGKDNPASVFLKDMVARTEMKFSQRQEKQADEFGIHLLAKAYGHCAGAIDFFEKLQKEQKHGKLAHFFSTHPSPEDRVKNLNKIIKENNYMIGTKTPLRTRLD